MTREAQLKSDLQIGKEEIFNSMQEQSVKMIKKQNELKQEREFKQNIQSNQIDFLNYKPKEAYKYELELKNDIAEWFSCLYDSTPINIIAEQKTLEELFKVRNEQHFNEKNYLLNLGSCIYGQMALLLFPLNSKIEWLTCQIIDSTFVNGKLTRVTLQDNSEFVNTNGTVFSLTWSVWIKNNLCYIANFFIDKKNEQYFSDDDTFKNLGIEKIEEILEFNSTLEEIPIVVIRRQNYLNKSIFVNVEERLQQVTNYYASMNTLPFWETGTLANTKVNAITPNQKTIDFTNTYSNKIVSIQSNGSEFDFALEQLIRYLQPASLMSTIQATKIELLRSIYQSLGIPADDDSIKSAQQTEAEIFARQFLSTPKNEHKKLIYERFLTEVFTKYINLSNSYLNTNFKSEIWVEFEPVENKIEKEDSKNDK